MGLRIYLRKINTFIIKDIPQIQKLRTSQASENFTFTYNSHLSPHTLLLIQLISVTVKQLPRTPITPFTRLLTFNSIRQVRIRIDQRTKLTPYLHIYRPYQGPLKQSSVVDDTGILPSRFCSVVDKFLSATFQWI